MIPDKYIKRAGPVADFLKKEDDFVIVSHYDADGLSSAGLIGLTLKRLGKSFEFMPVKKLDPRAIESIPIDKPVVFVDLGSGQFDKISSINNFVVCDHHEVIGSDVDNHLNAHLLGLDGATEVSGAGMSYLASRAVSKDNMDLAYLAVVGAVGDMQDSTGRLIGFNRHILDEGVLSDVLVVKNDIRLFGRHTRSLVQFLSYSSEPFFLGLSGNEPACVNFLSDLGIPLKKEGEWLRYVDLTPKEKKNLITGLYIYGLNIGMDEKSLRSLVGEVYEIKNEEDKSYLKDVKDFATLLNACGRHGEMKTGIMVAMGDRGEYYDKALNVLQEHRRAIHDAIKWIYDHGIEDRKSFYLLNGIGGIEDSIIGVVAGILYNTSFVGRDKPIIALARDEDGNIKVSGRANKELVEKGVNLGKVFSEVCKEAGCEGGGHNIAAGATVPNSREEEFLDKVGKHLEML